MLEICCQDKLILRVKTANDEVVHLQDFEYGESRQLKSQLKLGQKVAGRTEILIVVLFCAVVTNGQGQLEKCVRQIDAIIEAEKCKRQRLVR